MVNVINCGYTEFVKQNRFKRIFCFGAGEHLIHFSDYLKDLAIAGIIDNYKGKEINSVFLNKNSVRIITIEEFLLQYDKDCSIIITCLAFNEILNQLDQIEELDGMNCYVSILVQEYTENSGLYKHDHNISMIPKKIHYCWFGGKEIPEEHLVNMRTWEKYCPDYEIIRWDESNYNYRKNLFMSQAYDKKKWAFVSDYARVDILYHEGGIYLDTDVEVLKNLDDFLKWDFFCGYEVRQFVAWGLGFGCVQGHPILKSLLELYEEMSFIKDDGTLNETSCCVYQSRILEQYGFKMNGEFQQRNRAVVYPKDFFAPISYVRGLGQVTQNSHLIHWYSASWINDKEIKRKSDLEKRVENIKQRMDERRIKTSVIIPVYNTEDYLEECIQSVIGQTQKEIELILVDDGSTDRSRMIIDRYANKYPFIKAIHQENQKQGEARNVGFKSARGEYVYFMDSDDYIADDLLENCYQVASKDNLDFVMFDANTIIDNGYVGPEKVKTEIYDRRDIGIEDKIYHGKEYWQRYAHKGGTFACTCLFYVKVEFLRRNVLLFEPNVYYEDHEWSTNLYVKGKKIKYIPQKLYYRRVRNGSTMTGKYSDEHLISCIRLIEKASKQIATTNELNEICMIIPDLQIYLLREKEILEIYKKENRIKNIAYKVKMQCLTIQEILDFSENKNNFFELMLLLFIRNLQSILEEDLLSVEERKYNEKRIGLLYKSILLEYPLNQPDTKVGIYGMGKVSNLFLDLYKIHIGKLKADICFIDSQAEKNKSYLGYPIYSIKELCELGLKSIIVASTLYCQEMICNIKKYGDDKLKVYVIPEALGFVKD